MIKLLCIDTFENYELIDSQLLMAAGIKVIYTVKNLSKVIFSEDYLLVKSFEYDDLLKACVEISPDYIVTFSELAGSWVALES